MIIDINADMGESYGRYQLTDDEVIMPLISSANVACGYHAGDAHHIEQTIIKAKKHGLRVGAHPSYPDLQGFGRRYMKVPAEELASMIRYQVVAVKGICEVHDMPLSYVKPHGALYNRMARDEQEARIVIDAVRSIDKSLPIMVLAHSAAERVATELGANLIREAFIDRRYAAQDQLAARKERNGVIHDPQEAYEQLSLMVKKKQVKLADGSIVPMKADSYCIHGDNPRAKEILAYIHDAMSKDKITLSKA